MENESIATPQDISVGQLLKEARIAQGTSLEDVAEDLRINKRILEKLESDCETLVCDVYTLGFIRSYAQFLDLNATALIQKFRDQTNQNSSHFSFPTPLPEQGKPNLRILFLSLFVLVLVGGVAGYTWWEMHHKAPQQNLSAVRPSLPVAPVLPLPVAPPSVALPAVPVPAPSVTPPPSVAQETIPSSEEIVSSPSTLLQVTEETWIEVRDAKGEILLQRLFYPGENYTFENSQPLFFKTGNASGVSLKSGDKTLTFPGEKGQIKSGISLDPKTWPADASKRVSE